MTGTSIVLEHLTDVEAHLEGNTATDEHELCAKLLKKAVAFTEKNQEALDGYHERGLDPIAAWRMPKPALGAYRSASIFNPDSVYNHLVADGWITETMFDRKRWIRFRVPIGVERT